MERDLCVTCGTRYPESAEPPAGLPIVRRSARRYREAIEGTLT